MLDVYNLLNSDPVTNFNPERDGAAHRVIAVLDPARLSQLGFRFENSKAQRSQRKQRSQRNAEVAKSELTTVLRSALFCVLCGFFF